MMNEFLQKVADEAENLLDRYGLARRLLYVEKLREGQLARCAKDASVPAALTGQDGTPEIRQGGQSVIPCESPALAVLPKGRLSDVTLSQVGECALRVAREIAKREDEVFQGVLHLASTQVNNVTTVLAPSIFGLEDACYQINRHRLVCERYVFNRRDCEDWKPALGDVFDDFGVELPDAGWHGSAINVKFVSAAKDWCDALPRGMVYAVPGPAFIGTMFIRRKVTPSLMTNGDAAFDSYFGLSIPNARMVARLEVQRG